MAALDRSWNLFRADVIEPVLRETLDPACRIQTIREACLGPASENHPDRHRPHGCIFCRLAAGITDAEPLLRARLAEIFAEWTTLLGEGKEGWNALADIMGGLVLAFTVDVSEVVGA